MCMWRLMLHTLVLKMIGGSMVRVWADSWRVLVVSSSVVFLLHTVIVFN